MKIYIGNAFSLSMLDRVSQDGELRHNHQGRPRVPRPVSLEEARKIIDAWLPHGAEVVSCVGHADTAAVLGGQLGMELPVNRVSVKLRDRIENERGVFQDLLIVGQYVGPRLPEGATQLPEGAQIEWWVI